ncbi:insulinase family protein [Clostridium felsineum]|uniref:Uncharacterized protein n=1 Tax=Clostridium felsineum TaxID=36839 RepID=A0A1S8LIU8_9CLOT|nr:insulinase family protein [Clostridium felsineum]URZ09323.1 hypothetical protein CLROS_047390 [Clostridium felsineum]URZ14009.1 hypothetical protein CROST_047870 [Clostridium felsineum]
MLKVGYLYSGFQLKKIEELKDINSTFFEFQHKKSKAKLIYLENDDKNKVFSITFRTPPYDNTGIAHVLEHCVLRGSKKYSIKNPFVEIMKQSINSFYNALTFKDKTVFVAASMNNKSFNSIIDFYMDAVFNPMIYSNPYILMQEGWHYEIENKNEDITYNGIVLNEMRSVFSNPDKIILRKACNSLFPHIAYRFDSGGYPESILNITQKKLEDFHKKFYHPSNSYIYLYGKMSILEKLKFLDSKYLDNYKFKTIDSEITIEKKFEHPIEVLDFYSISDDEVENNKTYLSLNFVVGRSIYPDMYLAFEILKYILLDSSTAPLKRSLIQANFGNDIYCSFKKDISQPVFSIIVKNTEKCRKNEFQEVVFKTLSQLVSSGIDKSIIKAALNLKEFAMRESAYNQGSAGFIYNLKILYSWLYSGDPITHLKYRNIINNIENLLEDNYFERLIEKYLINNTHRCIFILQPQKKGNDTKKSLTWVKENFSKKELNKLIKNTISLRENKIITDKNSSLNIVSTAKINEIEFFNFKSIETNVSSVKVLYNPIFTNGIAYVNLYFNIKSINLNLIPYLSLLINIVGNFDTNKYNRFQLSNKIISETGGIVCSIKPFSMNCNDQELNPYFMLQSKVVINKLPSLFKIISELLNNIVFKDKDILRVIKYLKSQFQLEISHNSSIKISQRLMSYFSNKGALMDQISGISFYKFICDLDKNFYLKSEIVKSNLIKIYNTIFNKVNLVASVTISPEYYTQFRDRFKTFCSNIKTYEVKYNNYNLELFNKNEGFKTYSKVQFISQGYNFEKLGYKYDGSLQVLKTILFYDYLWNAIRVKGGAYGSGMIVTRSSSMYFSTIMDLHLKSTFNIFGNIPNYISNLSINDTELTRYKLKAISEINPVFTPYLKGFQAECNYFQGISDEFIKEEQNKILSVTLKDIKNFDDLVFNVISQDCFCVLGNNEKIEANKELFSSMCNIFY